MTNHPKLHVKLLIYKPLILTNFSTGDALIIQFMKNIPF